MVFATVCPAAPGRSIVFPAYRQSIFDKVLVICQTIVLPSPVRYFLELLTMLASSSTTAAYSSPVITSPSSSSSTTYTFAMVKLQLVELGSQVFQLIALPFKFGFFAFDHPKCRISVSFLPQFGLAAIMVHDNRLCDPQHLLVYQWRLVLDHVCSVPVQGLIQKLL
jgi:hypothetical protein